jgi:TP901 family phage tail tape measure protein
MSPESTAKINLILQLKDRVKTGITKAKEKINSNVRDMKGRLNDLKSTHVNAFRAMRAELPMFDRAMNVLGNPYVMVMAGALALGVVVGKTTKAAAEFQHEFLPIKQLNMDKPVSEMNRYQKEIKNAAFEVGANLKDSTNAMYDLQSGTGLFGKEAIDVFKKVGNYSLVTGANINDSMNATVKAMRAFGLEVKDIDTLLMSNAKTVQMGIVTFDQLAKVQTEYAGAASSAGQSIDTANKVFAAFTSIAKNADVAATMTKTAFQGLKQESGKLKKELGVDVFQNGKMRQADDILSDIAGKFKNMSEEQIAGVITKIGGPEGLRELLGKVQTGADDLLRTFDGFDKSQFNFAQALKNAKGDAVILADIAKNRLGIVTAEIGQKFLPLWVSALEKVNNTLSYVWNNFDTIWSVIKGIVIGIGAAKVAMIAFNIISSKNPWGFLISLIPLLIGGVTLLWQKFEGFRGVVIGVWEVIKGFFKNMWEGIKNMIGGIANIFGGLGNIIKSIFNRNWDGVKEGLKQIGGGFKQYGSGLIDTVGIGNVIKNGKSYGEAFKTGYKKGAAMVQEDEDVSFGTSSDTSLSGDAFGQGNGGDFSPNNGINDITGSAKQIKNLQVSIGSFVSGGLNVNNENIQNMNEQQLEEYFSNIFMRVVRNLETSYQ